MFQWNGHASIGNYWLYVGTGGAGSGNILSTGVTNTWRLCRRPAGERHGQMCG